MNARLQYIFRMVLRCFGVMVLVRHVEIRL